MREQFSFPQQEIQNTIDNLPSNITSAYPAHILEPTRIEIARELAVKEFYKLFPFLDSDDFQKMDTAMQGWLDGRDQELAPVHDYWNYIDGMMLSLKLKDIIPLVTSENISWTQETIDPKQLELYWQVGNLANHGKPPFNYSFVKTHIIDNPEEFAVNQKISNEKSTDTTVSRDNYPIITLRQPDDSIQLLDGNRRVMRAWLFDHPTITSWVGTVIDEPILHNHWVGTGFLRRLLSQYATDPRPEVASSVRSQLELILPSSSIAQHHYRERCIGKFAFAAKLAEGLLDKS